MVLLPLQTALLEAVERAGLSRHADQGVLGFMGVGAGKTLALVLAARALGAKRPVVIIPTSMRDATAAAYKSFPEGVLPHIFTYTDLSLHGDRLQELNPDVLLLDEAHNLKGRTSARTRAVVRFLTQSEKSEQPCRVIAVSGTFSNRSVEEWAHIHDMVFRGRGILPINWTERKSLIGALGFDNPILTPELSYKWGVHSIEAFRDRFLAKLQENAFIVLDRATVTLPPATIRYGGPALSLEQKETIQAVVSSWETPDGIPLTSAGATAAMLRNLATGFYYSHPLYDAHSKRVLSLWSHTVHDAIAFSRGKSDTEAAVRRRALAGEMGGIKMELARRVGELEADPPVPVWIDKTIVKYAQDWAQSRAGLIWFSSQALEEALLDAGFAPLPPDSKIDPAVCYIASIRRDGVGRNLQAFHANLVLETPVSGSIWEQLIGRTHRQGQKHPVSFDVVIRPGPEAKAFQKAKGLAVYLESVTGKPQRLRGMK